MKNGCPRSTTFFQSFGLPTSLKNLDPFHQHRCCREAEISAVHHRRVREDTPALTEQPEHCPPRHPAFAQLPSALPTASAYHLLTPYGAAPLLPHSLCAANRGAMGELFPPHAFGGAQTRSTTHRCSCTGLHRLSCPKCVRRSFRPYRHASCPSGRFKPLCLVRKDSQQGMTTGSPDPKTVSPQTRPGTEYLPVFCPLSLPDHLSPHSTSFSRSPSLVSPSFFVF